MQILNLLKSLRNSEQNRLHRGFAIRWVSRSALLLGALLLASGGAARDRGADGTFERRSSPHFDLYQDVDIDDVGGLYGSRRFEQQVLDTLERAYDALDRFLGLRPSRKIQVVVYDPAIFERQFSGLFRFSAAGFYAGEISVRGATKVHVGLVRVLHHELVHAALDAAAPSAFFPGWLNEGLAEWFEARALGKRHLYGRELELLSHAQRTGELYPLSYLSGRSFARLGPDSARLAYLQSYAMVEFLVRRYGERSLRDFCRDLVHRRDLDRALRRAYRADLAELEARFVAELS